MKPRWAVVAAVLLVAGASLRIISTYTVFNHTIDEPDNLAAGMEYLSTGRFLYEDVHPPLARVFGALGPFLAGERFHPGPNAYGEGYRILGTGAHYDRILALGRAGILPFFWVGSLVVFLWGRRAGGPVAAVVATLLFTTIPPVLALSGIINTDAALCAMTAAAGLGALWWADSPTTGRSIGLGVLFGLATVTKFSAIPYVGLGCTLMLAVWLAAERRSPGWLVREAWSRRRSIGIAAGVAALVIWAVYGFSFARVEFLHCRLPAPRFFTGLQAVAAHNRRGHDAYVIGRRSAHGFWYYFPIVLAVKTPLGLWVLLAAGVPFVLRSRMRLPASMALAFSAAVLLVSLAGHIDLGVRFLLPVYAGLCVAGGCVAALARGRWALTAVAALIGWQVVSGAMQHPDYLAYTNEITGGHPERFVADSDLDWGQDMKRLGAFLVGTGADRVSFSPFNRTYALPVAVSPSHPEGPSPGWNAVSVTSWKVFGFPAWTDRMPPPNRIGRSILVWYVPDRR
jgi:Dolichyl-phosphate-mannose-protein mannosyltransferase